MKHVKSQRGISMILELILVAVVFTAVGIVGYKAYEARYLANKPEAQPKSKQEAKVDPYANWKTFTSKADGLTFKYPADWKADISNNPLPDNAGTVESVELTGPSGLTVHYINPATGFGGGCDDPCTTKTHTYAHELAVPGSPKPVYLVKQRVAAPTEKDPVNGVRIGLLQANPAGSTDNFNFDKQDYIGFPPYTVFEGKGKLNSTETNLVYFYADSMHVDKNGKDLGSITAASPEKWFELPDVKTAELILKSAHY